MTNKLEIDRELAERFISDSSDAEGAGEIVIQRADWEELRALLVKADDADKVNNREMGLMQFVDKHAAPVVERQDGSTLMKIAADLANRNPLRQLYLVCEHQGRINTDSLHEHLDKCGDLLAGIALDIRRSIAEQPAPVAVVLDKYDEVLTPFAAMMRAELHANTGKGDRPGWLAMDRKTALLEIFYHVGKLQKAVKNGDQPGIGEYAADVANMAMMLADVCECLDKPKEPTQ